MDTIIDRLLILNPALEREDAQKAIDVLYQNPPAEWIPERVKYRHETWRSICYQFNIPRGEARKWYAAAQMGADVWPFIDAYLNQIGVTEALLSGRA